VAAICQFVESRRHRGGRGTQLGCAQLTRWRAGRRARLYRCPFLHQLDRQAIQHLLLKRLLRLTEPFQAVPTQLGLISAGLYQLRAYESPPKRGLLATRVKSWAVKTRLPMENSLLLSPLPYFRNLKSRFRPKNCSKSDGSRFGLPNCLTRPYLCMLFAVRPFLLKHHCFLLANWAS
jgi:hypothetical protein